MSVFKKKATVKTFFFELTNISKLWWHVLSKTQEFDKFTEKWINYLQKSANYTDICFLIRYLISDIGYLQKICKIYIILICKRYPLYDYLLLFYRYRYTTPIYLLSVICKKPHIVCFLNKKNFPYGSCKKKIGYFPTLGGRGGLWIVGFFQLFFFEPFPNLVPLSPNGLH